MKKEEIQKLLDSGETFTVSEHMIFKRGKLVRGTNYEYKCGDNRITETQFENVRHLLGANESMQHRIRIYRKV